MSGRKGRDVNPGRVGGSMNIIKKHRMKLLKN